MSKKKIHNAETCSNGKIPLFYRWRIDSVFAEVCKLSNYAPFAYKIFTLLSHWLRNCLYCGMVSFFVRDSFQNQPYIKVLLRSIFFFSDRSGCETIKKNFISVTYMIWILLYFRPVTMFSSYQNECVALYFHVYQRPISLFF